MQVNLGKARFTVKQLRFVYVVCVLVFTAVGIGGIYKHYDKQRTINSIPPIKGVVVDMACSSRNSADKIYVNSSEGRFEINVENYGCSTLDIGDTIIFHKDSLPGNGIIHGDKSYKDMYAGFAFFFFSAYSLYYLIRSFKKDFKPY